MIDKTTMGLVWHDCLTCLPEEETNINLYMTDGQCVINVAWMHGKFFHNDIPVDVSDAGYGRLWWADFIGTTVGYFEGRRKPSLKDAISHRELRLYAEEYACPREFGLETEYMGKFCPPGFWQGDCKKCWESRVISEGRNEASTATPPYRAD